MSAPLGDLEFRLLNDWQRGFPLGGRPYAELAARLDVGEGEVIQTLAGLVESGHISRIGAVFRPHVLGCSTLAAVACPEERVGAVAALIDGYPEVNHNYLREHRYNLWFVATAPDRARLDAVLADIHVRAGLRPLDLPMVVDYHIDLGFKLRPEGGAPRPKAHLDVAGTARDAMALRLQLDEIDFAVAAALEGGLTLEPRPYARLAARCGLEEEACLARVRRLLDLGVIRRFGVVVRHRELGYTANAMVVWDVPDGEVAGVGRRLAQEAAVTLCYQRPRRPPDWPYNLFSMVHGRDRTTVLAELAALRRRLDLGHITCQPLFSVRRFKQRGARYVSLAKAA